jgi:transcriptional regulator NrdR family protein
MTKATVDIDTQERKRLENLEKAKRHKEEHEIDTDKVERGVAHALFKFDVHTLKDSIDKAIEYAEKAFETAQRIEQRELRSKNAALSAYKMDVKEKDL